MNTSHIICRECGKELSKEYISIVHSVAAVDAVLDVSFHSELQSYIYYC